MPDTSLKSPLGTPTKASPIGIPTKVSPINPPRNQPRNAHMAQRSNAGLTQGQVGKEFGKHRTTVGRAIKQGFVAGGSAKD
jgi:hypothetical protein